LSNQLVSLCFKPSSQKIVETQCIANKGYKKRDLIQKKILKTVKTQLSHKSEQKKSQKIIFITNGKEWSGKWIL
jgi:hypothetical protein